MTPAPELSDEQCDEIRNAAWRAFWGHYTPSHERGKQPWERALVRAARAAPPALAVREPFRWYYHEPGTRPMYWKLCETEEEAKTYVEKFDGQYFPLYAAPDSNPQADQQTGSTGNAGCDGAMRDALSAMILEHDAGGITLATMKEARAAVLAAPLTRVEATESTPTPPESAGSREGKRIGGWCQWCGQATCFGANCLRTPAAALPQEAPAPSATEDEQATDWCKCGNVNAPAIVHGTDHCWLTTPPSALDVAAPFGKLVKVAADLVCGRLMPNLPEDKRVSPTVIERAVEAAHELQRLAGIAVRDAADALRTALEREHARAEFAGKKFEDERRHYIAANARAEKAERERDAAIAEALCLDGKEATAERAKVATLETRLAKVIAAADVMATHITVNMDPISDVGQQERSWVDAYRATTKAAA